MSTGFDSSNKYACTKCGHPFEAYKPDDTFKFASRYKCTYGDFITQSYACENCEEITPLYWHTEAHYVHDYEWEGLSKHKRIMNRLF